MSLRELLGLDTVSVYGGGRQAAEWLADQQATPKAATMTTLAARCPRVGGQHRQARVAQPERLDARVLGVLATCGYQPSEVESVLLAARTTDDQRTDD